MRNPRSLYLRVGFLDNDPAKRRLRVRGITGSRHSLRPGADRRRDRAQAASALWAVLAAPTEVLRAVAPDADAASRAARALPLLDEPSDQRLSLSDIRPLVDAEVMEHDPVHTSVEVVRGSIAGKRVLVTGAGGSIGAEICRQVAALDPAELIMLDRHESALRATQLSTLGHSQLETPNRVVADIRERSRVDQVFEQWRPEVVFHAAALKRVPLLEMHPVEAIKTNVRAPSSAGRGGALGVQRFGNISTDKAAKLANVFGDTKRIAERFTASAAMAHAQPFVSVRFGKVPGTRGSVLTTFSASDRVGGPGDRHPPRGDPLLHDGRRGGQLVLQAAVIVRPGEVLVLDMGEPVSIRRLAEQLVAGASRPVDRDHLLGSALAGEAPRGHRRRLRGR